MLRIPTAPGEGSAANLEIGDAELLGDAFRQDFWSLRFSAAPLEQRFRCYRARRARELGATPWVTRLGIVAVRALTVVGAGLAQNEDWEWEVAAVAAFGVLVLALYAAARTVQIRDGDDDSYYKWCGAASAKCGHETTMR